VEGSDFVLTPQGAMFLRQHGVDVPQATRRRRAFARRCLDWSERRDHLAGALGAALFTTWTARGWIARQADSRAVRLTPLGVTQLPAWGVAWPLDAFEAASLGGPKNAPEGKTDSAKGTTPS
jgi:hypothetical protein